MRDTLDLQKVAVQVSVGEEAPRYLVLERWLMKQTFARIASTVTPRRAQFTDITEPLKAMLGGKGYPMVAQPPEPMCTLDVVVAAVYFQEALIVRYRSRQQQNIWFYIFCFGAQDPQSVVVPWYLCVDVDGNIRDTWRRLYYPVLQAPWPWPVLQPNQHWAIGRLAWIVESTEPSNPLTALTTVGIPDSETARSLHKEVKNCLVQARAATTLKDMEAVADTLRYLATTRNLVNPLDRLIYGKSVVAILGRQIQEDLENISQFICSDYRGEAMPALAAATR